MIDVKTCRGANCDSDHYLVRIKVRQKLSSSVKTKESRRTKWNVERLKDKEIVEKFQNKISNLLTETHCSEDVESEWNNIKCAITGATSLIIGKKQFKRNEDWRFDQECADALNARNTARRRLLQRHTMRTQEDYNEKRRVAKKMCKAKRKSAINRRLQYISEQHTTRFAREMYKAVRYERAGFQPRLHNIKSDSGEMLT